MRVAPALLVLVACGHAPPPAPTSAPAVAAAAPATDDKPVCASYGYEVMKLVGSGSSVEAPLTAARADYDAAVTASEAGHPRDAALRFLDCAREFVAIEPGSDDDDIAVYDAHVCYYDAIYAFANANVIDEEGKAAMAKAAADDPRNADYIKSELVDAPHDCGK